MIETRESHQPLLQERSRKKSPGKRKKKKAEQVASYGTLQDSLKGEALLHAVDSASSSNQVNGLVNHGNGSAPPQSAGHEYQQQPNKIPVQQSLNGITSSSIGLPPIPLRRRAESFGDRSVGELSTVSGTSGPNRLQRSTSDGHDLSAGEYPRRTSRRSRSPNPKPPRSRSPAPNAGLLPNGSQGNGAPLAGHPLQHQRRYSEDHTSSSNRHRRNNSHDSTNSLYSINSQGSMNSETVKLLPDPRWGGGSGGSRARSFSGGSGSIQNLHNGESSFVNGSYSTDSFDGKQKQMGYGSIGSAKEVIMHGHVRRASEVSRGHRRNNSEVSMASFASAVSVDRSVEPVTTDMRKSSMFKGLTNKGVLKLQLPKDNFRLLSDRDLESGCIYKRALVEDEDKYFLDYHMTTTDDASAAPFEDCNGRQKPLPPSYYIMAVDSDIYCRMFDEVAESMNMPCKLFYCGHHEDVDYPSIGIAATGVVIIFLVMLWATIVVEG